MLNFRRSAGALSFLLLTGCTVGTVGPDAGTIEPPPDTGPPVMRDAFVPPRDAGPTGFAALGERCTNHTDCMSGYCVDPGGGGVCTQLCDEGCPTRWSCREVDLAGERLSLCVPLLANQCARCSADAECPDGACLDIDGEQRCAGSCTMPGDCPMGYTCGTDPGGAAGMFCLPTTGSCSCEEGMDGATRSCSATNAMGTCWGMQTCDPAAGWSACTAVAPAGEVCDGEDNDCNYVIDDAVGGGAACDNTVAGVGTCSGVTVCMGAAGFVCQAPTPMAEECNYLDDNCNGAVDEAFTDLGDLCSAGTGACVRFGALRCRADGSGTECSAAAGTGRTELCNTADDDCDGRIDETFAMLGELCTSGQGVCSRFGTMVCAAGGASAQCSATAGTGSAETCNYRDDDCNGNVDDGFRNATTGFYDRDTSCGSCDINCGVVYGGRPNSFGRCAVSMTGPGCVLGCNAGFFDLNGTATDGCEFAPDPTAIYVSVTAPTAVDDATCGLGPSGTMAGVYPCRTIGQGLARATATSRRRVLVADGSYDEAVALRNGIDLLGGYRPDTWARNIASTGTIIQGISSSGNHDRTVIAMSITTATLFEGFVVLGSFNSKPGGNSYAVYVSASSASLTIRNNFIYAGRGGSGSAGPVGMNGTAGANGTGRESSAAAYDAFDAGSNSNLCPSSANRQHINGGVRSCGTDNVGGGNGGGNSCPVSMNRTQQSAANGTNGQPADTGGGAGGAGGTGGADSLYVQNASVCVVSSTLEVFGTDGLAGSPGGNASGVGGCSNAAGSVTSGNWSAGPAVAGTTGRNGGAGGGGGGGGGSQCLRCTNPLNLTGCSRCPTGPQFGDRLGGHGGGGASGGCGGGGGGAGVSGGGVFGIFVVGGTAPVITNNLILRGEGGIGGQGGQGGAGGLGGLGGAGGQSGEFCAAIGGRGGDGGDGGHGSGGGGGCGGSSFGIFTSGVGNPGYCGAGPANVVQSGAAGPAGAGGFSGGAPGGSGQPGLLVNCSSI